MIDEGQKTSVLASSQVFSTVGSSLWDQLIIITYGWKMHGDNYCLESIYLVKTDFFFFLFTESTVNKDKS